MRDRIWEIVEVARPGDRVSRVFDALLLSLILLNVVAVVAGTVDSVNARWGDALWRFEIFSVVIFTLEYAVRVWSCTSDLRYRGGLAGRIRYIRGPMAIVDLLAVLPFYLPFLGLDLRLLRVFRLFRLIRLAKAGRYYSSLTLLGDTIRSRREELVLTFVLLVMLLLVASGGIYYCEHDAQPDVFSSMPSALWWSVVTLTTVGYGDAYPVTALGKVFASFVAVLGIGMFALPTGILSAGFVDEIRKRRGETPAEHCPRCGEKL